ncbi:DUF4373 domain-containing protein [Bacteroides sp.]|uniref:DUF4373 domain-containing protein n=1 Tax=Bacteroides sp. TaxID=29523 RepID=UPI0026379A84|nr:DUF4373 domain-containing protein [Bacteroides sp.]MDD3036499.1 DUF4373 domain-containing protein [Bacteroides sp.]
MGRIKQGLDYFPLNTDFINERVVRRIMKREGDSAFTILLYALSYIYSGEGYYVRADNEFYDELSDQLFNTDNDTVHRVLELAAEYGFFDSDIYKQYHVLTSADIQRQYLFITKRRNHLPITSIYRLLPEEEGTAKTASLTPEATSKIQEIENETSNYEEDDVSETKDIVTQSPENVTEYPIIATKFEIIKRKEKEKKENILPNPPSAKGGDEGGGTNETTKRKKGDLTQEDIDRMQAPADGQIRNLSGLRDNLLLYRISPPEQYAIILKSNYGIIGSPVWKGISNIRDSGGKIKLPGHYLLSVVNK